MAAEPVKYTMTRESITVVYKGKSHSVQKGAPQFNALRKALHDEDWEAVPKNLTVAKSIKDWAKGKFTLKGDHFFFEGERIPTNLNERITLMATKGEDPTPLFNFWERLRRNPSKRSVDQLWSFLSHQGIPITKAGTFLAYKGVQSNFKDAHTGLIDNKPGVVNKMPRNQISDDPREACHEGFHVGALAYAQGFSQRVIVCEVDPEHVVCVPYDSSAQKMRVCEYKVKGQHNGNYLSSTTFEEDPPVETAKPEKAEKKAKPVEKEKPYDPEDDFLAEECENCGMKIPPDYVDKDSKYHDTECASYDPNVPSKADEEKEAAQEKAAQEKAAKKKSGKEKKVEHKAKKKAGKELVKKYAALQRMNTPDLLNESLDTLRDYAYRGLKIVGATKVPGGKTGLIAVILKARE